MDNPYDGAGQALADQLCPPGCDHATATRALAILSLAAGAVAAHCDDTAPDTGRASVYRALTLLWMQAGDFTVLANGTDPGERRYELLEAVFASVLAREEGGQDGG